MVCTRSSDTYLFRRATGHDPERPLGADLREESLEEESATRASELIARSDHSLIETKAEKELGLPYRDAETALGDALVVTGRILMPSTRCSARALPRAAR